MDNSDTFKPTWKIHWIETEQALAAAVDSMSRETLLGVDTETVGWQVGAEKLCLIQFGLPQSKTIFLIDTLTIKDLSPLGVILGSSAIQKIVHNASFEARQFERHKLPFEGAVDTLTLARRLRPDLPNHTLKTCCKELLGISLSKEEQTSDWSLRPLSQSQQYYAAADAEVAVMLFNSLDALEAKLRVDPSLSVPELMELLSKTSHDRFELTKDIAPELAFLNARYDIIREQIKRRLESGEPNYEGEFGKALLSQRRKNEISVELVRKLLPEIAEMVIASSVERKRLLAVMKEYGISPKRADEVTQTVGYTTRLDIELGEDAG